MSKDTQSDIQKRIQLVTQIEAIKKQLGWSFQEETKYVQSCFNKAYRAFLSLEELQMYLDYLRSQSNSEAKEQTQNQLNLFES